MACKPRAAHVGMSHQRIRAVSTLLLFTNRVCFRMQPLSVDWREKLKANRKASSKGARSRSSPEAASPSPGGGSAQADVAADVSLTADGKPNLELLSKGLPAGWRAMWDKNTGDIYYGSLKTRVRDRGKDGISFVLCTSLLAWYCAGCSFALL